MIKQIKIFAQKRKKEFVKGIPDEGVTYFRNEKNSGPEFSRNFGLRQARGKYITFLDDDDYYTDYDFFAKAVKIFEEHDNIALVCTNAVKLYIENGELITIYNISKLGRANGLDYFFKCKDYHKPYSLFPTIFNADILRQAGLEGMNIFDSEIYYHAALYGDFWIIADIIRVYRDHIESNTRGYRDKTKYSRYNARRYANLAGRIKQNGQLLC